MSNRETKDQEWQAALQEMQVETDPEKLSEKLQRVETLIQERLQDLYQKGDGSREPEALKEALFTLRVIKRDKLGFPDWQ
jgi:predicted transcriptional regulator